MASGPAEARTDSPWSAQPLLSDFDGPQSGSSYQDKNSSSGKAVQNVSERELEDGERSSCESEGVQGRFWQRWRMGIRRRREGKGYGEEYEVVNRRSGKRWSKRKVGIRALLATPLLVIFFFGIVHLVNVFLSYIPLFFDSLTATRLSTPVPTDPAALLDITRDVTPIPCHSHNDYWRRVPLYDALRWGCTGVEADVWLFDGELYVGHNTNALTQNRTLRKMYVDPLVAMLDHMNQPSFIINPVSQSDVPSTSPSSPQQRKNGIFPTSPLTPLILLIDFKNSGPAILPYVIAHLSALRTRSYLTHYNGTALVPGPVTVVATGNAPFDLLIQNTTYRDIFFDAPLARLSPSANAGDTQTTGQGSAGTTPTSHFTSTNSYYASAPFRATIGTLWLGRFSRSQRDKIRQQVRAAHDAGLKARYWGAPSWPVGLRNRVWRVLWEEGVDMLNGDDLRGMGGGDWWAARRHVGLFG